YRIYLFKTDTSNSIESVIIANGQFVFVMKFAAVRQTSRQKPLVSCYVLVLRLKKYKVFLL
ncbi:MAG: hypothetical protein PHW82_16545, partial [Bacteroidales bacterium]|nr:hypothetical protein [Bacteroidales bacterium]